MTRAVSAGRPNRRTEALEREGRGDGLGRLMSVECELRADREGRRLAATFGVFWTIVRVRS